MSDTFFKNISNFVVITVAVDGLMSLDAGTVIPKFSACV